MMATMLSDEEHSEDGVCWGPFIDGDFMVRTAYDIANNSTTSTQNSLWNKIWKLGVPERVKMFMWVVKPWTHHDK